MPAFRSAINPKPLRPLEKEEGWQDAPFGFSDEIDLRSELSRFAEGHLAAKFPIFAGMHLYLEVSLTKAPFVVEAGLFGPLALGELTRLNQKLAPLAKADIDISVDNDEDPFTGERYHHEDGHFPWLPEAEAASDPGGPASKPPANMLPDGVPAAEGVGLPSREPIEEAARPRFFRPYLTFHVDGHGDEGRRGAKVSREALAKKHLSLMQEAAGLVRELYARATTAIEEEARAIVRVKLAKK